MNPHPRFDEIATALASLRAAGDLRPWNGLLYRYTSSKYASGAQILSGIGAYRAGGRWGYRGVYHAIYCASNPDLGHREYFAWYRFAGLPLHKAMPLTGKAIEAALDVTVDLREATILSALGVTAENLRTDPWRDLSDNGDESLCQAIGRAALNSGGEALFVPSAHAEGAGDFNVVLVRENIVPLQDKLRVLRRGSH
ncbi:MAG: RES family NAD+ phosphorylase [Sumerlaeia bacterium]